jgi:hypothetical protein
MFYMMIVILKKLLIQRMLMKMICKLIYSHVSFEPLASLEDMTLVLEENGY